MVGVKYLNNLIKAPIQPAKTVHNPINFKRVGKPVLAFDICTYPNI
jgi:hypothetical protein